MKTEIPIIEVREDVLMISIPLNELIFAIENRPDEQFKVVKPENLLSAFQFHLVNYSSSNATELGISEFQNLLDKITDEVFVNEDEIIINIEQQ